MAEEFTTQLVMDDAAGMVTEMSSNSGKLGKVADLLEQVLDKLLGNGGRVNDDGSVSGVNSSLVGAGDGNSKFDVYGLMERVSERAGRVADKIDANGRMESIEKGSNMLLEALTGSTGKTGLAGSVMDVGKRLSSMSTQLGTLGESFAGVSKLLGKFASGLGIAATAMEVYQQSVDMLQNMRDVSMSQTGSRNDLSLGFRESMQSSIAAFATGLSEKEAVDIQQRLIAGRVPFDSDRYNEGYQFAQSARLNYTMDVNKAVDLYVKAVARGSMTVDDLNKTLDSLAETAKRTGATMDETIEAYEKMSKTLEQKFGGEGTEMANDLSSQLQDLNEQQKEYVQNMLGNADLSHGSYVEERVDYWNQKGYGSGESLLLAARDYEFAGMGGSNSINLRTLSLGRGERSVYSYVENGDWDGLLSALQNLESTRRGQYLSFVQDLKRSNLPPEKLDSPEGIVETFKSIYGDAGIGGMTLESQFGNKGYNEIVSDYSDSVFYSPLDEDVIGEGYSNDEAAWNKVEVVSNLSRTGDFSSLENGDERLKDMLAFLIDQGFVTNEDLRGMESDEVYDMLRSFGQMYVEEGGIDKYGWGNDPLSMIFKAFAGGNDKGFDSFLNAHRDLKGSMTDSWRENFGEWRDATPQFFSSANGEREHLDVNVEVTLAGDAGELMLLKTQEAQWKRGSDDVLD